jgi:hypothetical protein
MSETSAPLKFSPHSLLSELLARKQAQTSLTSYIEYSQLGFVPAAHHRLLIQHLEEVERGDCPRLMVYICRLVLQKVHTRASFFRHGIWAGIRKDR